MNVAALRERLAITAGSRGAVLRVAAAKPDAFAASRMRAAFQRDDFTTWRYDGAYAVAAADPATVLPGARSVVCVALPYATPQPRGELPSTGRISNYAWSADYHVEVRALLRELAASIEQAAGPGSARIACDTAPLAERAFAANAGLGWVGKHTNLIVPGAGSFVFLGEVVTTVDFVGDAPSRKSCGSCTRCIAVCPTGALRGDYTIDATRCISDLTQRTDGIPRPLRPFVGTWVWGCDLCQIACPPSQRAGFRGRDVFSARSPDDARPSLEELLVIRGGAFKRRFAKTAIGWRGPAVLRRNAAVALGNTLDRAASPALTRAAACDASAMVRAHAAWALGRLASPAAYRALERLRAYEVDPRVCEEIDAALEPYPSRQR